MTGVEGPVYAFFMVSAFSRVKIDKPGKDVNPARGKLNRENEHFPVPVRA